MPNKVVGTYSQLIPLIYIEHTNVAISCTIPPPKAYMWEFLVIPIERIHSMISLTFVSVLFSSLASRIKTGICKSLNMFCHRNRTFLSTNKHEFDLPVNNPESVRDPFLMFT